MASERDRWLGQRLAAARRAAGLTVRELAERLGWPEHSRVSNYESGRRSVTVVTLFELAHALGIPAAALLVESAEETAVIAQVAGNRERAQQIAYLLALLDEPEPPLR